MERKGGLKVDPAVADFQRRAAVNSAALTKKQRRDRKRVAVRYDLSDIEVKAAIEGVAAEVGTTASQVGEFGLMVFLAMWEAEGEDGALHRAVYACIEPSRSMRFEFNVNLERAGELARSIIERIVKK